MGSKPKAKGGSPYRILYWFGAVLVVLVIGVVYLGSRSGSAARLTRTAIWLAQPSGTADARQDLILLIEELPRGGGVTMLLLPARLEGRAVLPGADGGRAAAAELQDIIGYRVRNYLVIPEDVLVEMINYGPRLTASGQPPLDGQAAAAYLFGAPDPAEQLARAGELLPQFFANAFSGRLEISLAEGRRLFGRMQGNLGILDLADRGPAWFGSGVPALHPAPGTPAAGGGWQLDRAGLDRVLHPDEGGSGSNG